ncbi:AEC family transporter [Halocella sp. SP3-1]|uniref:AEC family transporter n=1 Tax=Halocella sp. SP3-1 TaxID=2382161 RepID=UPI000F750812|nr:AEC family transporter [Halocella sp. SP3-1]AZO96236.1 AEC family transporter [Halocella sp. SP3-1]
MSLEIVINQILVLFFIILIGYAARKKDLISEEINKGLSRIMMDITLPALIIYNIISVELSTELLNNLILLTVITFISYLFVLVLSSIISNKITKDPHRKTVFKTLLIFANVGYMGLPVLNAIYPDRGILYGIINNIIFNIILWTYGVYIFIQQDNPSSKGIKLNKILSNGLLAVIIGFILLGLNIKLGPIKDALNSLGGMTFPLSMLIIGSSLTNVKLSTIIKDKHIYYLSLLKLIIIPIIGLFILNQFNIPDILRNISVILLAMPSGAIGVILAEQYNGDYKFASEGVFITTLCSIVTIPLIIVLIDIL